MSHVCPEPASNDAVPCRVVHCVELCLQDLSDVVEDPLLLEGVACAIDRMLLHLLRHVRELYHGVLCLALVLVNVCRRLNLYHVYNYLFKFLIRDNEELGFWGFGVLVFCQCRCI